VMDAWAGGRPDLTEPAVARHLVGVLPEGATLVVASSMPVRDVEWYGAPRAGLRVLANRGANGIDGVVSTATGVALSKGGPTAALVGDVALLHDSNALLGLARRPTRLAVVVVDNRGGGIFSFLPQAAAVPPERFELLFGTPHDVDLAALAAVHGLPARTATTPGDYRRALAEALDDQGSTVVVARTERAANVAAHDELHAAIAARLSTT
jgi:2-succinyl-5-enolpyruvyl-6-hydroxy-3-cyclohexene-1-carboxylate synthase